MFNDEQQKVIDNIHGDVLVNAVAGSGKTTTILARVQNMIDNGFENILMISFTRTASENMKKKYSKSYTGVDKVTFGTIHSLCLKIVKEFTPYDASNLITNQKSIMYEISKKRVDKNNKRLTNKQIDNILSDFSTIKVNMLSKGTVFNNKSNLTISETYDMYDMYESIKNKRKQIDFNDLLIITYELLCNESYAELIRSKYEHIIVDEFQDTSKLQFEIICKIKGDRECLCVVGDTQQSIYGFQNASPEIMLNLPKRFPNITQLNIDMNYRCDNNIIDCANKLLKPVPEALTLRCSRPQTGNVIMLDGIEDDVIDDILASNNKGSTAILFRTNIEGGELSSVLSDRDIEFYATNNSICSKYKDAMFDDIKAFLRMSKGKISQKDFILSSSHPNLWISNADINKTGLDVGKIYKQLYNKNKSQWKNQRTYDNICKYIDNINYLGACNNVADMLSYIYRICGYNQYIKEMSEICGRDLDYQFKSYIKDVKSNNIVTIKDWNVYILKYNKALEKASKEQKGICLSTIHSAKGLEWDNVYIVNFNDGNIPYIPCDLPVSEFEKQIQEERRLFYVAITRAKHNLNIYSDMFKKESRFKKDII